MMILTVKWSKHAAAIYKCYIKLLAYQIKLLLTFSLEVFTIGSNLSPIYRQSLHTSTDSNPSYTRYEMSNLTLIMQTDI
jgi:hypothetical protein